MSKTFKFPFIFLTAFLLLSNALSSPVYVYSKTQDEIEKEIDQKEKELDDLESELTKAEELVAYFESQMGTSSSQLENIETELKKVEAELELNKVKLDKYKKSLEFLELDIEKKQGEMNENLVNVYINDRRGLVDVFLSNGQVDGFWKDYKYRETLLDADIDGVNQMAIEAESLKKKKLEFEKKVGSLSDENKKLATRKQELTDEVSYYNSLASYNASLQSNIRAQMGAVQQDIEGLNADLRAMMEEEAVLIGDVNGGTKPLVKGEYYFYGRGRALYQGHGLGFSQYGAYGGGKSGMSGTQIAKFYYPGTVIGTASGNIDVIGYGTMNIETYVSGLGEIPDKACGNQSQVNTRPDKYRLDDPNSIWDCWPENTIEAQVIVARSYALAYGGPICTSASCQVYKGGTAKKWAADETKGKVLKSGGSIIKAYYSSDNNNGWGTATHRNPVWCWDFAGNCGSGFSWLQGVNDSSFAVKGPYTDWMWRTNSYSLKELQSMLEWYSKAGYTYPSSSDVKNLLGTTGTLKDIQFVRDVSGRASKVRIVGSKGTSDINGEFFKIIFNFWVGNKKPSGEVDPVFSLTFYFKKAE
ncbi:MAG: SpoIID/LytB domain-containing protein [Candidatus Dojkabacteria bacterium]|nr:SpoIID/LytB domain-containing protein [Candidatus Dojkabacteria bacterium]